MEKLEKGRKLKDRRGPSHEGREDQSL